MSDSHPTVNLRRRRQIRQRGRQPTPIKRIQTKGSIMLAICLIAPRFSSGAFTNRKCHFWTSRITIWSGPAMGIRPSLRARAITWSKIRGLTPIFVSNVIKATWIATARLKLDRLTNSRSLWEWVVKTAHKISFNLVGSTFSARQVSLQRLSMSLRPSSINNLRGQPKFSRLRNFLIFQLNRACSQRVFERTET